MAKKFIDLKLRDENDNDIILKYRLGPKAAQLFFETAKVTPTPENLEKLGVKGLVYMLYAGCKAQHQDLTIDKIWDLVDNYEIDELEEITNQITQKTNPNV